MKIEASLLNGLRLQISWMEFTASSSGRAEEATCTTTKLSTCLDEGVTRANQKHVALGFGLSMPFEKFHYTKRMS